jgi:hypothetical protein
MTTKGQPGLSSSGYRTMAQPVKKTKQQQPAEVSSVWLKISGSKALSHLVRLLWRFPKLWHSVIISTNGSEDKKVWLTRKQMNVTKYSTKYFRLFTTACELLETRQHLVRKRKTSASQTLQALVPNLSSIDTNISTTRPTRTTAQRRRLITLKQSPSQKQNSQAHLARRRAGFLISTSSWRTW